MDKNIKTFGCVHCGSTLNVSSPDDAHPDASLKKEDLIDADDSIEMTVQCKKCKEKTILYWGNLESTDYIS